MPKRGSHKKRIKEKSILAYVDFSNFIGELNNILNTSIFQRDEDRYIELSKILAKIIHSIFVTLPEKLSQYGQSSLAPFRLYCYGSYFGAGRRSYNAFKEEIINLGNTELYFIERGRGAPEKRD